MTSFVHCQQAPKEIAAMLEIFIIRKRLTNVQHREVREVHPSHRGQKYIQVPLLYFWGACWSAKGERKRAEDQKLGKLINISSIASRPHLGTIKQPSIWSASAYTAEKLCRELRFQNHISIWQ